MAKQPTIISDIKPPPSGLKRKRHFARLNLKLSWRRPLIAAGLIGLIVIFALLTSNSGVRDPFTKTQQITMGIPLYYPNVLPSGYHIDYNSVSIPQKGVIVFKIDGPKSGNIYVSEELTPSSDVVSQFTGNIVHPTTINTSLGSGIAGTLYRQSGVAATILTNNKTWIIVNSNTVSQNNLKSILQNLVVSQ